MPIKRFDKTEQLAVGVGTAALTFTTATSGNRTYAAAGAEEGDQFWARIEHETLPAEWELCLVTIVGGTIVRSTPEESSTGAAVAFSAGNKIISDGVPFRRVPTPDGDALTAGTTSASDRFAIWDEVGKAWKTLTRSELDRALEYDPEYADSVPRPFIAKMRDIVSTKDFGAHVDNDDNSSALQSAIDAVAPARKRLYIPGDDGELVYQTGLVLPSFTEAGNAWDENNPFKLGGDGPNSTRLRWTGASGAYAIAHSTIGGVSNRGQNYGLEIADFTLIGPQNFNNAGHGVGIDNTRRPILRNLRLAGFPGGVGIHLYGHQKGGIFGAQIIDCYFGNNEFLTSGGEVLYSLDEMAKWSMRYALWLDGAYNTTGKVNDIYFRNCTVYEPLIGCVKIEGHGTWNPETSVGSSANFVSSQNVYFMQSARKMEEGVLTAVTSTTVMDLRLTDIIFDGDDDLNGFYLAAKDSDGRWHRRYIADFVGATRQVTLEAALPFTPTTATEYRIGFADAAAKAAFPNPEALQHVFRWASRYSMMSLNDYCEEALFLVAHAGANNDVSIVGPEDVVNDNIFSMRDDGSWWSPRFYLGQRPRGSDQTPAQIITGPILVMNPEFDTEPSGVIMRHMINATSGTLENGDVVRLSATGAIDALDSTTYTSASGGHYQHGVVYSPQNRKTAVGGYCTVAVSGHNVRVKVSGVINNGDPIVPMIGGVASKLPRLVVTANATAQAGSSTTITLASAAASADDYYVGGVVSITGGTGAGQSQPITAYVGSTRVATTLQWATAPDATSTYRVVMFAHSFMHRALGKSIVTSADAGTKLVRCSIRGS